MTPMTLDSDWACLLAKRRCCISSIGMLLLRRTTTPMKKRSTTCKKLRKKKGKVCSSSGGCSTAEEILKQSGSHAAGGDEFPLSKPGKKWRKVRHPCPTTTHRSINTLLGLLLQMRRKGGDIFPRLKVIPHITCNNPRNILLLHLDYMTFIPLTDSETYYKGLKKNKSYVNNVIFAGLN